MAAPKRGLLLTNVEEIEGARENGLRLHNTTPTEHVLFFPINNYCTDVIRFTHFQSLV